MQASLTSYQLTSLLLLMLTCSWLGLRVPSRKCSGKCRPKHWRTWGFNKYTKGHAPLDLLLFVQPPSLQTPKRPDGSTHDAQRRWVVHESPLQVNLSPLHPVRPDDWNAHLRSGSFPCEFATCAKQITPPKCLQLYHCIRLAGCAFRPMLGPALLSQRRLLKPWLEILTRLLMRLQAIDPAAKDPAKGKTSIFSKQLDGVSWRLDKQSPWL